MNGRIKNEWKEARMNERKHAKTNEWPGNGILGPVPAPGTIIIILFPFCPPDPPGSWINWLPPTCNQEHQKIRKIQNFFLNSELI